MEITYNLVKDLLEKYGYYTTDKVIWDTINNINKLTKGNKKGQDIHAVCLEGMPGSGKTFYAETYQKVLEEMLSENVEMIDFQCDATTGKAELNEEIRVAAAITGDANNVIIEGKLVKAIKAVNEGKKVILFLDEFEKAREDTDTYLYQFLQKGKINTVQLGDLEIQEDKKKNLQVILCKNYFRLHLSEPLERRLKFMRLEPMKPEVFLKVANKNLSECDKTLVAMVSILYEEIYKNRELFKRVPSCSELFDAINDANDILEIAPDKYILDAILSNMIKNPEDFEVFADMINKNKKLKQISNLLNGQEEKQENKKTQLQYAILEDFFSDDIKKLAEELEQANEKVKILSQSNSEKDRKIQEQAEILESVTFEQGQETNEEQITELPETIKIGADYEVYHSNGLDEQPTNIQAEGLRRYRLDKSIFDYSNCEWNEIGSFELLDAKEEDSRIAKGIINKISDSVVCRDGYILENNSDFKLLIYKVREGNNHRYRIFSDKLVITKTEIAAILNAMHEIYYNSDVKRGGKGNENSNINFKFLIASEQPRKEIDEEDVKMLYQMVDNDIYNVNIKDNKNSVGFFIINYEDFFEIKKERRDLDTIYSVSEDKKFTKRALNKHYELIHKNLISRAKEKLNKKEIEQSGKAEELCTEAISQESTENSEKTKSKKIRKIIDYFR